MFSDLSILQLVIIALSAMFVGLGKSGIVGAGMVTIPIFAAVLGGKPSTGFLLPLLILADFTAILKFKTNTRWEHLLKIFPWVAVGVTIAALIGNSVDDKVFNIILAVVILIGVALMLLKDYSKIPLHFFENQSFYIVMGVLAGFSSMIGNAAGNIISIFLLSLSLPKNEFIATRAWFFFITNMVKIPLHVFYWKTINYNTLIADAQLLIFVLLGMILGFWLIKRIKESVFRKMVLFLVIASAFALFFR